MIRSVRFGLACFALIGAVSCQKSSGLSSRMNRDLQQLEERIMPSSCRVISRADQILRESIFRREWECETDWSKERYDSWVKNGLSSDFKRSAKASGPVFTRYDGNDFQSIEIESGAENGKLRVRAVFLSYPD
jgi:hypothetical protein